MTRKTIGIGLLLMTVIFFMNCKNGDTKSGNGQDNENQKAEVSKGEELLANYAEFTLTTDLSHLSAGQKKMLGILMDASDILESLFWQEAIGDKEAFLAEIEDPALKEYAKINYGPWDRINGDKPFIEGYGEKPAGAQYYPEDITKEEFKAWDDSLKTSWYTLVRRGGDGELYNLWYHEAFTEEVEKAAELLEAAAQLAENADFKEFLNLRAEALRTDDYLASDLAWMDMRGNKVDVVIGPIESYEDQFMGYRAAHSGQILIKDLEWSKKLSKYGKLLPKLQACLPVEKKYKQEKAHSNSDMNVYDVIYYAGDCNAGSKNIAINLPNDPRVHKLRGTRKLMLKNAMKAKFDKILVPISKLVIAEEQQSHVNFDAFFENVMFHEVAHGLGVKQCIDGQGTVREVMADAYSPVEEAKADITGLYLITQLHEMGEITDKDLLDNYVTFIAGIFRSTRFGIASAHGKANMMEFAYLKENGAFKLNENDTYEVDFEQMKKAVADLSGKIITLQGDGDYEAASEWVANKAKLTDQLKADLKKIEDGNIATDVVFKQGKDVLGI